MLFLLILISFSLYKYKLYLLNYLCYVNVIFMLNNVVECNICIILTYTEILLCLYSIYGCLYLGIFHMKKRHMNNNFSNLYNYNSPWIIYFVWYNNPKVFVFAIFFKFLTLFLIFNFLYFYAFWNHNLFTNDQSIIYALLFFFAWDLISLYK